VANVPRGSRSSDAQGCMLHPTIRRPRKSRKGRQNRAFARPPCHPGHCDWCTTANSRHPTLCSRSSVLPLPGACSGRPPAHLTPHLRPNVVDLAGRGEARCRRRDPPRGAAAPRGGLFDAMTGAASGAMAGARASALDKMAVWEETRTTK
jgi:hypothetical protein